MPDACEELYIYIYIYIYIHTHRGHYLFRQANSFPRAKLEKNCELRQERTVSIDRK